MHELSDYIYFNITKEDKNYDSIKYEAGKNIYYYGKHFRYNRENSSVKHIIYDIIKNIILDIKCMAYNKKTNNPVIISNAYFSLNDKLKEMGYNVFYPFWSYKKGSKNIGNYLIRSKVKRIYYNINYSNYKYLISEKFMNIIDDYKKSLKKFIIENNVKAVIVPNDLSFFENMIIKASKETGILSFVFLHGLPSRYNSIDDNRADYLLVWGKEIKKHYIRAGVSEKKIIVSGHPNYNGYKIHEYLKFNYDDILVITKSAPGTPPQDKPILYDRGNMILYLYSIRKILNRFGINKVRFRPHPSENPEWYYEYLDRNFYRLDKLPLNKSLEKSSLVIGPSSTVFLEALLKGVNYLIYEPLINGHDLINYNLVPPFDGSEKKVPVAFNEMQLEELLKYKKKVDPFILKDYIRSDFNLSYLYDLIKINL